MTAARTTADQDRRLGPNGADPAQRARFPASPDRAYYLQLAERIGGNRACVAFALARKLLKRSYHILKALGDDALKPAASDRASGTPPINR